MLISQNLVMKTKHVDHFITRQDLQDQKLNEQKWIRSRYNGRQPETAKKVISFFSRKFSRVVCSSSQSI